MRIGRAGYGSPARQGQGGHLPPIDEARPQPPPGYSARTGYGAMTEGRHEPVPGYSARTGYGAMTEGRREPPPPPSKRLADMLAYIKAKK